MGLITLGMQEGRSVLIAKISYRLHVDELGEKKQHGSVTGKDHPP